MSDSYLWQILQREAVDTSATSPVLVAANAVLPVLRQWAGTQLVAVRPSGSWAKGTANSSGTDIDLFVSLAANTTNSLKEIYETLATALTQAGYSPRRQNVSIGIKAAGYDVDLVPARLQGDYTNDHSLYRRRADTWTKTNIDKHIQLVSTSGLTAPIRVLKLWRNQWQLDFPSFYLELSVISALAGSSLTLSAQVIRAIEYLRDRIEIARVVDPANTNNIISDDLSATGKQAIQRAAVRALAGNWEQLVR